MALLRRIYLTFMYRGLREVARRALAFARARPVTIVIPSYRDAELVAALVAKIGETTRRRRVRIVVADDASGPEHLRALRRIEGIAIVEGERNGGFSVNVNRGLRAADPRHDVVLLNSDVVPLPGWLEKLQYAATRDPAIGIVGPKLLYPDGRIQYGGTVRNLGAPEWFDHRYRFRPADWGPANVGGPTLAATAACMYIRREALDAVGLFDAAYPMAYEDVDYGLRTWQAGFQVVYAPEAQLYHLESVTRGTEVGERERTSQTVFWERWGPFLDEREVRTADDSLRVVYVTEDTTESDERRRVLEQLNGLAGRGHDVQLWTLGAAPGWFDVPCPVRSFSGYDVLSEALAPLEALKIATGWRTATPVWNASVLRGIPVYFVQDIETARYAGDAAAQSAVVDSYHHEFRYMTTSEAIRDLLRELHLDAVVVASGELPGAVDAVERFLGDVARPRRIAPSTDVVPGN